MSTTDPIECVKDGYKHGHSTFAELERCVGDARLIVSVVPGTRTATAARSGPAGPVSAAPSAPPVMRDPTGTPTEPQLKFIRNLGGSWRDAAAETKAEASALIEMLKNEETKAAFQLPSEPLDDDAWAAFPIEQEYRRDPYRFYHSWDARYHHLSDEKALYSISAYFPGPAVSPIVYKEEEDTSKASDSTILDKMLPLLDRVHDGYYAVEDEWNKVHFIRISVPKSGTWRNYTKVQTIHGDRLELAWTRAPHTNRCVKYTYDEIETWLLKIIIDASGCARRYAREIDKCCRCNARLTDDRSRKYGIGPECEKHWPWIIDEVDQELAAS